MRGDLLYAGRHVSYYIVNALFGLFVLCGLPKIAGAFVFQTPSEFHYGNVFVGTVSYFQHIHFAVVVFRIVRSEIVAVSARVVIFHSR